eukprot:m.133862 g.133862  ORF g.133862 m.133862 type:complete len:50 (+) comp29701_c0_seq1:190-339(+)
MWWQQKDRLACIFRGNLGYFFLKERCGCVCGSFEVKSKAIDFKPSPNSP